MAKISKVVKNERRKDMVKLYAVRRAEAKKIINNPRSTPEEVDAAVIKLQKMPRDASPIRGCATAVRRRAARVDFCGNLVFRVSRCGNWPSKARSRASLNRVGKFEISNLKIFCKLIQRPKIKDPKF